MWPKTTVGMVEERQFEKKRGPVGGAHFFENTPKKWMPWRQRRARGLTDEWVDESGVVFSDVTGICCFWDGRCRKKRWSQHVDKHIHAGCWVAHRTQSSVERYLADWKFEEVGREMRQWTSTVNEFLFSFMCGAQCSACKGIVTELRTPASDWVCLVAPVCVALRSMDTSIGSKYLLK